uniref:ABC transporter substrate-binding protein n=1 Tax=Thermosporothrix sp. COM3 TaxID=2490863 RepID=A0A455SXX5_9CHLR|nr:ABC transporter substrate-binding protein [Thermosporothrix sp. COM3]
MTSLKKVVGALTLTFIFALLVSACSGENTTGSNTINVVATTNFYGNIAEQIGGKHVTVTSIITDPEVDPHEYESNVTTGKLVAQAQLVLKNGGGYDEWMDKLLSASPNENRTVVTAYDVAPTKLEENEHVWYSPANMKAVANSIAEALKKLDSTNASAYDANLKAVNTALGQIEQKMNSIKATYAGTPIGQTESIFSYQSNPMNLKVITPEQFQEAVAEGNDPPASVVATTNKQVTNKEIKVLVYNEQTVTPLTTKLQNEAKANAIPLVSVTETMPKDKDYQNWMLDQLNALESALKTATGK